jgi:hypothetical protein
MNHRRVTPPAEQVPHHVALPEAVVGRLLHDYGRLLNDDRALSRRCGDDRCRRYRLLRILVVTGSARHNGRYCNDSHRCRCDIPHLHDYSSWLMGNYCLVELMSSDTWLPLALRAICPTPTDRRHV